jgi:SET domain-containing protein
MMNDEDLKEFHDLDRLKPYNPLPSGIVVADSGINGQGLFATRKLVSGTELGVSHYRIEGQLIRTPLGGFINHSEEPNCLKNQIRIKPGFDKWNLTVIEDIEEGSELTLKYTWYEPRGKIDEK